MDFPVALMFLNPGLVTANPDNLSVPEVEAGGPDSRVDLLLQPPTLAGRWRRHSHTCLESLWE